MKNTKYAPLITLILFVLCFFSCKDEVYIEPPCCGPPSTLSLHIADIEGVGTSEIEQKYFPFKVSMYYLSKTGVKTPIPRGRINAEFKEVKKLEKAKKQKLCNFRVENCLSLYLRQSILETISQKEVKRLFVKVRQDIDTIDLTVKYNKESYLEYEVKNFQINGKTISPLIPDIHFNPYYFSKTGKKPKITCPSE